MLILDVADEVRECIQPDQPAVDDEGNPIAEPFGFLDVVSGEEYSRPGLVQRGKQLPDLPGTGHIDPGGRFIEEQNGWLVDDPGGDRQLSLHPFGVGRKLALGRVR